VDNDRTDFDHLTPAAAEFVFQALDLGLEHAAQGDFLPFATVLEADGGKELLRVMDSEEHPTVEGTVTLARQTLHDLDPTPHCVTLVQDGYLTGDEGRADAVIVEAYEVGQPAGVVLAQRYERTQEGVTALGNPVLMADETAPMVASR
jgi:hypothetical protein